jgi:endonuclease/exonuclease/phosphatase family metal-dependent hydrolase
VKQSSTGASLFFLLLVACSDSGSSATGIPVQVDPPTGDSGTGGPEDGSTSTTDAGGDGAPIDETNIRRVRIVAANTTSGTSTSYEPLESIRLFQGLKPDVALLQEVRYKSNSDGDLRAFVDTAFGTSYAFYREPAPGGTANDIPNGIVSRFPIVESGSWDDPNADNRGFAWAKIEIPNAEHPLWAVSVHFLTSSGSARNAEAVALVAKIKEVVPEGDYLVVGGDYNTAVRTETCITTLSEVLTAAEPWPDDGAGNDNTNGPRNKPFDWLLVDEDLTALHIPVRVGTRTFAAGLVFDSRVYEPLVNVAPIQAGDSEALNMQHMPVVRDFAFPK